MYQSKLLPNTRIDVADALRGIAVAGIILFHSVEHFNIFTQEPIAHTLSCDLLVEDIMAWILSGKMYGIFAMLFGLSFFIMNDNQQQKGRSFSLRFAWRMILLFLFGLVNMAFYDGDILMIYAMFGLLMIPISYLPSAAVWCIIGVLAVQPIEIYRLVSGWEFDTDSLWALAGVVGEAHQHGTFWENTISNLRYGLEFDLKYFVWSGRLTQILCLFILGMQLGRQRLFYNEGNNLKIWHIILAISSAVSITLSFFDFGAIAVWLKPVYCLFIIMMITSGVVSCWYAFDRFRKVLNHLRIFGRMSLTNYLLQSIIGSFIFCGYGLSFYNKVGVTYAVLIGLLMVVCQYIFCRIWFRNHQRGLLEDLWRKATWINIGG